MRPFNLFFTAFDPNLISFYYLCKHKIAISYTFSSITNNIKVERRINIPLQTQRHKGVNKK